MASSTLRGLVTNDASTVYETEICSGAAAWRPGKGEAVKAWKEAIKVREETVQELN